MKKLKNYTLATLLGLSSLTSFARTTETLRETSSHSALLKADPVDLIEFSEYSDGLTVRIQTYPKERADETSPASQKIVYTYHGVRIIGGDVLAGQRTLTVEEICTFYGRGTICKYSSQLEVK